MIRLKNLFVDFIFRHRLWVVGLFLLCSLFLAYEAAHIRIDAGFEKQLPLKHPYIQNYLRFQQDFGGANRLLISARVKKGDIFDKTFLETFKKITDESYYIPGVDRSSIESLFTPNVQYVEIVEGGFSGGNLVPPTYDGSPEAIATVKNNLLKSTIIGRLVANNFDAALVNLRLTEEDPLTRERVDYFKVSRYLEEKIRQRYENDNIQIEIIGFAMAIGNIIEGVKGVLLFLFIAVAVVMVIANLFIKNFVYTVAVIGCSGIAVIWNLGLITLAGYGIDPLSILVPFLVFSIGTSHGLQVVNRVMGKVREGVSGEEAAKASLKLILVPGLVALISDGIGFITINFIQVKVIQHLAITASLGVTALIFSNILFLPIALSFYRLSPSQVQKLGRTSAIKQKLWHLLSHLTEPKGAIPLLVVIVLIGIFGLFFSQGVTIGDSEPGLPELRSDHRYNRDTRSITKRYDIGVDQLNVIAVSKENGCVDYDVMKEIDLLGWEAYNNPHVHATISLPKVIKILLGAWNEGHFKWRELSRDPLTLGQPLIGIPAASGLRSSDCELIPVYLFLKDHKAESINSVVGQIENFKSAHEGSPVDFRIGTGNITIMAATNATIADAQFSILFWVYLSVAALCLALFRCPKATLCVMIPLLLVSLLAYSLMNALNIGLKISTLPIAALGVGIGVDYGIYIFTQMAVLLREGTKLKEAYATTLMSTGNAVLMTGIALSLSVLTWVFSDLKFQVDMGILLSFMLLVNMLGAVLFIPALAWLFFPKNRA